MAGPVLVAPGVVDAASPDDARRIDEWATRARAELTRLALAVRTAEAKLSRAEADAEDSHSSRPDTLLAVVDATLTTASRKAQDAVESARREADTVVGVAARLAADLVREAGLDPARVGSIAPRRSRLAPHAAVVPSADELWDRIVEGRIGRLEELSSTVAEGTSDGASSPGDAPPPSAAGPDAPSSAARPPRRPSVVTEPGPPRGAPVDPLPAGSSPSPAEAVEPDARIADEPSIPAPSHPTDVASPTTVPTGAVQRDAADGPPDAARVYEMFWARVPDDHPVRARLRLRPARGR